MFSKSSGSKGKVKSGTSAEEKVGLLESGQRDTVGRYLAAESDATIDTSSVGLNSLPPRAQSVVKEFLLFSNFGYLCELVSFVLITLLGFKYVFSGCLLVGGSMLCLGVSVGWLSIPQLVTHLFVSNWIVRWFLVTNHSYHITALFSILALFTFLSYFAWTNTCRTQSVTIQSSTTSTLTFLSVGIVLFLIACYRNEKGNAGYIRWILRLVI